MAAPDSSSPPERPAATAPGPDAPEPPSTAPAEPGSQTAAAAAEKSAAPSQTQASQPVNAESRPEPPVLSGDDSTASPVSRPPLLQRLRDADKYWAWKVGIRALLWLVALVGIACAGWVLANGLEMGPTGDYSYYYYEFFYDKVALFPLIICLVASLVWSTVELLVRFLRRASRPVHPGLVVGVDMLFFLALVFMIYLTVAGIQSISSFGTSPRYEDGLSYSDDVSGQYVLDPATNTWVFNVTGYLGSTTTLRNGTVIVERWNSTTSRYDRFPVPKGPALAALRKCTRFFSSCADQDAWYNSIWRQKPTRVALDVTAAVMQSLAAVCHFALWVWGCVDVHLRRRAKKTPQALAADIVEQMVQTGRFVAVPPGFQPAFVPVQAGGVPDPMQPFPGQVGPQLVTSVPQPAPVHVSPTVRYA